MLVQHFVSGQPEPLLLRIAKTTSSSVVNSRNKRDLRQSHVPKHYVCNKFIQHFNKKNLKQITRVELKLAYLYNTLRDSTLCAWCHVICCRSFPHNGLHTVQSLDVVEWSRALGLRLGEWCCSVSMVWVQIPSREEHKFDSSKI